MEIDTSGDPVGKDQSVIPESEMMPAETQELCEDQQILKLTPLRRSTRTRRQPDRLTYTTMQMDSIDTSSETASETVVDSGTNSEEADGCDVPEGFFDLTSEETPIL